MVLSFRPNYWLTLLAVIFLAIFVSLGFWQLQRAKEKEQILSMLTSRSASAPISLQALGTETSAWQYQPVQFSGEFLNSKQFLLDNKINQGHIGYEVITPIQVAGLKKLVLVNRGWIAAGQNRKILPQLKSVFGLQTIHGIIRLPSAKGLVLKADVLSGENWPIRIQQVDFTLIEKALGQSVYPFVVLLDKQADNGYVRDWQFVNAQPAKNIGYAVQWFAFAGVLLIIYFGLTLKRREKKKNDNNG